MILHRMLSTLVSMIVLVVFATTAIKILRTVPNEENDAAFQQRPTQVQSVMELDIFAS